MLADEELCQTPVDGLEALSTHTDIGRSPASVTVEFRCEQFGDGGSESDKFPRCRAMQSVSVDSLQRCLAFDLTVTRSDLCSPFAARIRVCR